MQITLNAQIPSCSAAFTRKETCKAKANTEPYYVWQYLNELENTNNYYSVDVWTY